MKKLLTLLVVGLLVLAGCSSDKDQVTDATLTVINGAPMVGDFVSGYGNNSYDTGVRTLINGEGVYYVDAVTTEVLPNMNVLAEEPTVEEDEAGNVTYTFKLKEGHKWSNDADITALDYVFSHLFRANPAYYDSAVTRYESTGYYLLGYAAYRNGETDVFEGVKLIDDYTFALTIDAANLPYYYERVFVAAAPDPTNVWMPNAELNADGNGFANSTDDITAAAKLVKETERFSPSVSSGPYILDNYDSNNVASLSINPNYSGDHEGKKPTIGKIVVKNVESSLLIDAIIGGEGDLTTGVIDGADIKKGREAELSRAAFARNAYGKILFNTQKGTTAIKEVRQAIGYLVDRGEFVEAITGGYGKVVDGPYGLAMSFYNNKSEEITSQIHQYNYNPEIANELLDKTDYVFEADGVTPFDATKASEGGSYFRHNAAGEVLEVNHYGTVEASTVTDLINSSLPNTTAAAGLKYTVTIGDWTTMTGSYMVEDVENPYQGYNFATSYSAIYDPTQSFHSDFDLLGNYSRIVDPTLDAAIEALVGVEPGNTEGFENAFVDYVVAWNDLLPELPLYSNEVYSFATDRVTGLDSMTPTADWYDQIVHLSIVE